jgi:HEAT repeat protein
MYSQPANLASIALAAALLGACAATEPDPPAVPNVPMNAAQIELCREVEQAYRSDAPDYEALRDRAAADPVTALWVTRMFVRDILTSREGRQLSLKQDPKARLDDRAETRAIVEIQLFGAAAVPAIVGDLLSHAQPQPREVGIELLGMIGPVAAPAVAELADSDDPRRRRAVGRALGAIGDAGNSLSTLRRLATDGDFAVRADALRELHDGGDQVRDLLIERLRDDPDAFVRRVAAESLARFPSKPTQAALADYRARCRTEADHRGETTAKRSLEAVDLQLSEAASRR